MPASRPDLLFALVGDVRLSSRALRQLRWLSAEGLTVEALTLGPEAAGPLAEGVHLTPVVRPPGSGPRFFWAAHRAFREAARTRPARLYLASDLFTLPALAGAARRHGGRLAFDSRELYPHVDATAGKPWARAVWSAVERRYVPRCDAVLTVNESIAERLARTYRIPTPTVVYNVAHPVTEPPDGDLRQRLGLPENLPVVLYQGLFNRGRGLEALVEAMAQVPEAALVLVGDGPLREPLAERLAARLPERGRLLPFTPPDALRALTGAADLGVCALEPISESVRLALPNKLFEYLAAGVPVVVSDLPEMARVVRRFDVGLVVPPGDADALAGAIRQALADGALRARWRRNIPRVFEAFSPEADRQRFVALVRRLLDA